MRFSVADQACIAAIECAIEAGIHISRRVIIAGTGHIMYLEKPEEFSWVVFGFLEWTTL
jgi:pimeloyl-ACP methyl ester carboxylesterase